MLAREDGAALGAHSSPIELGCPPSEVGSLAAEWAELELDSPSTAVVVAANTTIVATIADTPEKGVAASLVAATVGPFATVAAGIRQLRAFATALTAWQAVRRATGSNWRASSHAFHRMSSYASTGMAAPAAGGLTTPVPWETCTWGTAAEAALREMTGDAPGTRLAEYLAAAATTGVEFAADAPSGQGSEAGLARAPTEETTGQSARATTFVSAGY